MQNKYGSETYNNFLEFISIIALIISYILFVYQSFLNHHFANSNSREIIAEKILFQNFSEEVYYNIGIRLLKNITRVEKNEHDSKYLNLEVKLDSYFDCRGETNGLLNEKECQNKIVNNLTCCRSVCCIRNNNNIKCNNYNFNLNKAYDTDTNIILNYNYEEIYEDPRRKFCTYFNKYNNSTSKLLNTSLKVVEYYNYEELILQNEDDNIKISTENIEGYTDCGELDTLKNHLYLKNRPCPINYIIRAKNDLYFDFVDLIPLSPKKIIVRNILSELPPNVHEWNNYNYNYKEQNDKIITIKDINKVIKDDENFYEKQNAYFYIDELSELYNTYKDKVNNFQKLYWYTSNYIGFKKKEDLLKFKNFFDSGNPKNNPLYKITKSNIYPSQASGVIAIFFIIFCIAYISFSLIFLKIDVFIKEPLFIVKEIIILISIIIGIILLILSPRSKYQSIDINMDAHYKEILDLYNKRRNQKYFLASFIILCFVVSYEIYFFFFAEKNPKSNKDREIEIYDNNENLENQNQKKPDEQNNSVRIENVNNINSGRPLKDKSSDNPAQNSVKNSMISSGNAESLNINKNKKK